ncbi:homoserine kinase [Dictyobacter formicarum]|uniref:Homoserine kinase n=2 Tax=Dictyobacter formicarum TaxID=2778368 RepID=A0ABQ3VH70_9CHLR|nr:homoserine kinase [Dictyobacter formicarum]
MAVKTTFSAQEFREILSYYNLGEYQGFTPISHGSVQTNFFLQTTQGRFVFRYYENRSIGSVLFESHLIQYLKGQQYPCPALLLNRQGEAVGIYREKPYIIFEFIEGQHLEYPDEMQKRQFIQEVAQLQNITRDYQPVNKDDRWNYDIDCGRKLARQAAQRIDTTNAREKLAWFEHTLSQLQLPASLPRGICHCDFHFSNILFKDGNFAALIDFDDANYTFLTYDLATLINPFIPAFDWDSWSDFKPGDNIFDFSAARETVLEYNSYRPLSPDEKQYLFDVFKLSIMFDCVWYFERGNVSDFFEKRKIDALNNLGRDAFYQEIFG